MKSDYVFLSEDGRLTSSSAAHLRNMAASKAESLLSQMRLMHFTNKFVQLIGDKASSQTQVGLSEEQVEAVPEQLYQVIRLQAFEAWMNEGIAAKRRLYEEIKQLTWDEFAEMKGIERPEMPKKEPYMTEDDYLTTVSIKDRNRYFMLQTEAAAIGKLIHKGGAFDAAMKELQETLVTPTKELLNGRDSILHNYSPSVNPEVVDAVYFKLQNKHREAQAELNGMKDLMEKAIDKDSLQKDADYQNKLTEYNSKEKEFSVAFDIYRKEEEARIAKLKIVIPDHLLDTYKELSALGK